MNGGARSFLALGTACALGVVGVLAQGDEAPKGETARFAWARGAGAESCASAAELQADVDKRLGRDAFAEPVSKSIEGTVTREGGKWIARLYVRDLSGVLLGQREITSDASDCKALGSAVTLAVALAIDPEAALAPPPSVSASASTSASSSSKPKKKPIAEPPLPPPLVVYLPMNDPERGTTVSARAVIASGLLPRPAIGAALAVDPDRLRTFHPTFGAVILPSTRIAPDEQVGFAFSALWLGGCARLAGDERVVVSACASAWLGVMHAVVYSLEPVAPGDRFWAGLSGTGRASVHLVGPLFGDLGFDLVFPLTRHRFLAENRQDDLFQQPFVTLVGWVGAAVRFR